MNISLDDFLLNFLMMYPALLFSLSVHEAAHALTAKWGGDMYSAYQGRITLNPLAHIDPIGTVLIPIVGLIIPSGLLIGWAKPVPVIEQNFRRGASYGVVVALAGPFSNLLIALFTATILQVFYLGRIYLAATGQDVPVMSAVEEFLYNLMILNVALMVFNLMPVPPLDGSHVLWHWFVERRPRLREFYLSLRPYGFMILLLLLWTGVFGIWFMLLGTPIIQLLVWLVYLPAQFF